MSSQLPATPERSQADKFPYTPTTPNDNDHGAMIFKPKQNLAAPVSATQATAKTPRKGAVYTGANSLITPDFTPKIRKRKDIFDSLAVTEEAVSTTTNPSTVTCKTGSRHGIVGAKVGTISTEKTALHPQPSTVGSGRNPRLMKAPEVSPRKRGVPKLEITSTKQPSTTTPINSGSDSEFSNSESPTKSNFLKTPELKPVSAEKAIQPPTTPTSKSTRVNVVTPPSKLLHTKKDINDEYEPHYTLSSPSIFKAKKENKKHLQIFKTKKMFLSPQESDKENADTDYEADSDDLGHDEEIVEFNPHTEILLSNREGEKMIKKFDMTDKFDREFKPRLLINDLLKAQKEHEPEEFNESAKLQRMKRDDEFVKQLLRDQGESSDEEFRNPFMSRPSRVRRSNPFGSSFLGVAQRKKISVFRDN